MGDGRMRGQGGQGGQGGPAGQGGQGRNEGRNEGGGGNAGGAGGGAGGGATGTGLFVVRRPEDLSAARLRLQQRLVDLAGEKLGLELQLSLVTEQIRKAGMELLALEVRGGGGVGGSGVGRVEVSGSVGNGSSGGSGEGRVEVDQYEVDQ